MKECSSSVKEQSESELELIEIVSEILSERIESLSEESELCKREDSELMSECRKDCIEDELGEDLIVFKSCNAEVRRVSIVLIDIVKDNRTKERYFKW